MTHQKQNVDYVKFDPNNIITYSYLCHSDTISGSREMALFDHFGTKIHVYVVRITMFNGFNDILEC